ncbi:hypothetical protein GQ55_2G240000 [Panicum hallii var. hallii]|uniref:Uncharacterized protein n=1 Tax=Panicum hallii var. hallii TaxID=1504633 RepID=A0A2T7ERU0_9POAL|nr:hypothetical protein GQ55_2G240000 [Panicum hallii var. hallii]
MDGMRAAPSDPNLPTFFRWCLGGMAAAFASGSGSGTASARDADADAADRVSRLGKEVEVECGDISASQEDLLARAPFLGGGGGGEEEAEVFSTPPLTQGQQSQQSQQDQGVEEEEDAITMCSLPFTQPSPSSPYIPSSEDKEDQALSVSKPRKPRVCTRKVRGVRIRTPTPSPSPSPDNRGTSTGSIVDPLYRAVLMIPTTPAPPTAAEDLLVLARNRGIF